MPTQLPRIRLEILEIANPCPADWTAMRAVDGDRVRFCRHCEKQVFNLSALSRDAGEQLVAEYSGSQEICVRMYKRADGTVVNTDCRGQWRASTAGWLKRWGGPVGAVLALALLTTGCEQTTYTNGDDPAGPPVALMGAVVYRPPASQPASTQPAGLLGNGCK